MPPIFAALMVKIVINILLVIHVIVSLLIVLLVLMQRPKNEGLGAAFGGGATDQLFGAQTTNVLQTITRWLGFFFFTLTITLSVLYVRQGSGRSALQEKLSAPTVIPATPTPSEPAAGPIPSLDGKEPLKIELGTPPAGGAASDPAKLPALPAGDAKPTPEAPNPDAPAAPAAPAPDAKPAEPAPAEPKAAEPAK